MRLAGRVAIVTGGARGIGGAIAVAFAAEGADVALADVLGEDVAAPVLEAIARAGRRGILVPCNVSGEASVSAMVAQVESQLGDVDILVNDAGTMGQFWFHELTAAEWDRVLGVNLRGVFLCTRAVIDGMLARGRGKIINVASQLGQIGGVEMVHYSASKAGVIGFTRRWPARCRCGASTSTRSPRGRVVVLRWADAVPERRRRDALMFDLHRRVAVITGAASGIGAATARVFSALGADVALGWFPGDPHDVEPVRAALSGRAVAVEVDVQDAASVDALVSRAVVELGRVDIAVANAGIARRVPLPDDAAWHETLDVDLTGAWRLFRVALPHMRRERYGRLLATSSVAGTVSAWPEHPHYAAAKAGLVGLIQTLAVEYGPDGITANAVAPGVIETPQALDPVNSLGPEALAAVGPRAPVRRVAQPEDIAHLFAFLASEEVGYVSGQLIVADGARSAAGL